MPGASTIEDFVEDSIKATVLFGKTFNPGNGFDPARHYGKKVFAHRVVRPQADKINFAGFRPLVTNLVAAIQKHRVGRRLRRQSFINVHYRRDCR